MEGLHAGSESSEMGERRLVVEGGHAGSESSEMGERRLVVEGKEDCDVPVATGSRALEGIAVDA